MKHGHILIVVLLGAGVMCCSCSKQYGADSRVNKILKVHRIGEWELDVSKLSRLPENPKDFLKRMSGRIDIHTVPYPSNMADIHVYEIIVAKEGQRFWIRRSGGFAWSDVIYGVGALQEDGTIMYVEPTAAPDKE